jgi:hypothetical protein
MMAVSLYPFHSQQGLFLSLPGQYVEGTLNWEFSVPILCPHPDLLQDFVS